MAEQQFTTEELDSEIWKPIPGYEGFYSASSIGRIRRDAAYRTTSVGRILQPCPQSNGYLIVSIAVSGSRRTRLVHHLIATTFLGPTPEGKQLNHRDGDKRNNGVSNLEFMSAKENAQHAHKLGLCQRGTACHASKLTDDAVRYIRTLPPQTHKSIAEAVQLRYAIAVSRITIGRIRNGLAWKHIM